jgi:membrane-associated protein
MEIIKSFLDFFLHLDHHMAEMVVQYGMWIYGIVFAIIFCETGLVVMPFLPGDSLLFVLGALAAKGTLRLDFLLGLLTVAAILGNTVNYMVGKFLAPRVFGTRGISFIRKEYLIRTQKFYDKHGPKTIILTRFLPILRTVAPFLAGVAGMGYAKFLTYNVAGGLLWVFVGVLAGFFFGNLPIVSENFSLVVLVIVVVSLVPAVLEFLKHKKHRQDH